MRNSVKRRFNNWIRLANCWSEKIREILARAEESQTEDIPDMIWRGGGGGGGRRPSPEKKNWSFVKRLIERLSTCYSAANVSAGVPSVTSMMVFLNFLVPTATAQLHANMQQQQQQKKEANHFNYFIYFNHFGFMKEAPDGPCWLGRFLSSLGFFVCVYFYFILKFSFLFFYDWFPFSYFSLDFRSIQFGLMSDSSTSHGARFLLLLRRSDVRNLMRLFFYWNPIDWIDS